MARGSIKKYGFIPIAIGIILGTSFYIFSEPMMREVKKKDCIVQLDLTSQVLTLAVKKDKELAASEEGKKKSVEARIYPDVGSVPQWHRDFISAAMVAQKAKHFDDGLIAAVELLCQKGTDTKMGKQEILKQVLETLKEMQLKRIMDLRVSTNVQAMVYSALVLGGGRAEVANKVSKVASDSIKNFLKEEVLSKPIGVYTWTDDLKKIFKQDRFLQKPISQSTEQLIFRKALYHNTKVGETYKSYLTLVEQMTNAFPREYCDFRKTIDNSSGKFIYAIIPPSVAHETELMKQLYGNKPIPKGFSLIDALIKEIVSGKISLMPSNTSGWYDYKTFALEPFLMPERMPEAAKLVFEDAYKKLLVSVFKSVLALTRETHIKSLEVPLAGSAMPEETVDIYPGLSCEPLATYYLRLGQAYSYIRKVLEKYFSEAALKKARRLKPYSLSPKPLSEELKQMESLMYGLFLVTSEEIGLTPAKKTMTRSEEQQTKDKETAKAWIKEVKNDQDLCVDNRMMVPVFYDVKRKQTKVWIFLGYSTRPITISYKKKPTYVVTDLKRAKLNRKVKFKKQDCYIIYPVSAEVYTEKILNREEFHALCDKYKTQKAILKAIKSNK